MRDRSDYLSHPTGAPMRVNKPDGSVWILEGEDRVTIERPDGTVTTTTVTALTARGLITPPVTP